MSEFKHTPGPWRIEEGMYYACIRTDSGVIADMRFVGGAVRNMADARLIAAAPDMFHALNLALEYWQDRQQRYKNRSPVWVQEARAAIAKALGEQS